ncbi:uncharacterized protein EV422DRAFT_256692 [Fimicolochytrium jonesii]|uniref:uncharacterized protein n=1 Tax=Fimicolochytrium jonesii TaxID=1396493 RepID=UPI0022FDBB4A|nr:uncharacterized protein EV422DRAFT_256692 [Fimicolochytrium jonesii]KAI8817139.1 hypothetical protein EV422DRAFT_256692 [Fimicolochytrium jonesii]
MGKTIPRRRFLPACRNEQLKGVRDAHLEVSLEIPRAENKVADGSLLSFPHSRNFLALKCLLPPVAWTSPHNTDFNMSHQSRRSMCSFLFWMKTTLALLIALGAMAAMSLMVYKKHNDAVNAGPAKKINVPQVATTDPTLAGPTQVPVAVPAPLPVAPPPAITPAPAAPVVAPPAQVTPPVAGPAVPAETPLPTPPVDTPAGPADPPVNPDIPPLNPVDPPAAPAPAAPAAGGVVGAAIVPSPTAGFAAGFARRSQQAPQAGSIRVGLGSIHFANALGPNIQVVKV